MSRYRGRFAPSPTGPLHAGSLATALASWLDARAANGIWVIRIEDLDAARNVPGAASDLVATLARFGLESDTSIVFQSARDSLYQSAFDSLQSAGLVYGCACSRKEVDQMNEANATLPAGVYSGTCSAGTPAGRLIRAYRVRVPDEQLQVEDRSAGTCVQQLRRDVGDFILRRADGLWAYQLAVVVDDAEQEITDVVRGADLLDNTPRQMFLQRCLGMPTPRYMHVPVVLNTAGQKLSKQSGAVALNGEQPVYELQRAARHLGLGSVDASSVDKFLKSAVKIWISRIRIQQGVS